MTWTDVKDVKAKDMCKKIVSACLNYKEKRCEQKSCIFFNKKRCKKNEIKALIV